MLLMPCWTGLSSPIDSADNSLFLHAGVLFMGKHMLKSIMLKPGWHSMTGAVGSLLPPQACQLCMQSLSLQ